MLETAQNLIAKVLHVINCNVYLLGVNDIMNFNDDMEARIEEIEAQLSEEEVNEFNAVYRPHLQRGDAHVVDSDSGSCI